MTLNDTRPVIEQPDTEIPLMLAQAIIVAGVLAVGEIACSPLYFTLMDHSLALVPWALEAVFLAVAFSFVVGFAILWCAESFTFKLKEKFRPFGYAVTGLIGYGVWSLLVFTATINSVLTKVGENFIAFFFSKLFDVKLGNRKGMAIAMLVAEVIVAVLGLLIMIRMFSVLYAA